MGRNSMTFAWRFSKDDFVLSFRALREFAEDVETQIQGLNAEIDTQTLAGGAKINRLFYNEFADALSLVSRN